MCEKYETPNMLLIKAKATYKGVIDLQRELDYINQQIPDQYIGIEDARTAHCSYFNSHHLCTMNECNCICHKEVERFD